MFNFFKNKNVIHVEGGNTFYLLKAIRESGFAEVLKELLNEGKSISVQVQEHISCVRQSKWQIGMKPAEIDLV